MNKTIALIDALEQRLALVVGVAAVAFSAADPTALSPKWAGIIAAAVAVSHVLAPAAPVVVQVPPAQAAAVADLNPAEMWDAKAAVDPALNSAAGNE